jgi:hypothetical protein
MAALLLRAVYALLALSFALSIAVQYNDPDPLPWMGIYAAALVVVVLGFRGTPPLATSVATALLAGIWGMTLLPDVPRFLESDVKATRFTMKTGDAVEEDARECGGLFIVMAACTLTLMDANARRRRSVSGSGLNGRSERPA